MSSNCESKDLDCSNAYRGVWLVKVPKYISDRWNKSKDPEVGRLRITKGVGGKRDIVLTLSDNVTKVATDDKNEEVPKKHKFAISTISSQSLAVFSQTNDKVALEGRVVQRAECRPIASDAHYMQLKKNSIVKASKPQRAVKHLEQVVNSYKPVSVHKSDIDSKLKKEAGGKYSREDKDKVLEMLFAAFEKHQYYNIKDLVRITRQPITYLKEILKDICTYNIKNPHKNMWELKAEYRHYKTEDQN